MTTPTGGMQEGHTYRLATHPESGDHGYEVGYWPPGADLNDPAAFVVVERVFSQTEAQAAATRHNSAQGTPKAQSHANLEALAENAGEDEDEAPHKRAAPRHRR